MEKTIKVNVKYFNQKLLRLQKIKQGDWIDVRVDNIVKMIPSNHSYQPFSKEQLVEGAYYRYKPFEYMVLGLGFVLQLPKGYEAELKSRSSTFKNYSLLMVNGVGTIDESYRGDDDEWVMPVISLRAGRIKWGDRIGQFRIREKAPNVIFSELKSFSCESRSGLGSTGIN